MKTQSKTKPAKSTKKPVDESLKKFQLTEGMNIKEISEKMDIKAKDLLEKLRKKNYFVSVSDIINKSLAKTVSQILNVEIELISFEEEARKFAESQKKELVPRPPVVTIMGHVDHGKTTLLDSIRQSNLVKKESGGITQHIGAYRVLHNNRPITFIDTPGHEAFTKLRARGANLTDIVILIVAADDGVMPQTKEAINHAKAANVPILVAINKIDKPEVDVNKVKQQLSKEGLIIEEWGGDTVSIDISAKEKTNLKELLDMILLLSDIIEIKTNLKVPAQGVILEARLDSKKGAIATVIIQHGILNQGEAFISGTCFGKARALFSENRTILKKTEPSMPVEILGFSDVPKAGDLFQVVSNLETAKKISQYRLSQSQKKIPQMTEHLTLDQLFEKTEEGKMKELHLIIKADVQGSVEVLSDTLPNLSTDNIKINIIHSATGNITESDILLASASNAIVIGYNIKPNQNILDFSKEEKVEIRSYNVIYQLIEDIKKAMVGMLEPVVKETYLGRAEIKRLFRIPHVGIIAGCLVTDGKITRNSEVRLIRENEVIHQDKISSLKHIKNNVTEVKKDYECGIRLANYKDIQEGDIIESFIKEKVRPE